MKLATIFIGILLISSLLFTACQKETSGPDTKDAKEPVITSSDQTTQEPEAPEVDLISEDEVEIGELI